jgi:diadenosine tetraphosphate (Ap4A) HIT family hydrolase
MDPCYFCEIIGGATDQWSVIERTALTITLLNTRQFEVGQCMVVPNRHAPTLLDLSEEEGAAVMAAAKRAASAFVKAFAPDGVLLYQNNGVGSGQEVPHFHLHVVPRQPTSDWGFGPPHIARLERNEGRPPHLDHAVVTDAKREAAQTLRAYFSAL